MLTFLFHKLVALLDRIEQRRFEYPLTSAKDIAEAEQLMFEQQNRQDRIL